MGAKYGAMKRRAETIATHGTIRAAVQVGKLEQFQPVTLSEALVLGLLNQGVRKYIAVFGHGSTDIGQVLAVYEQAGMVTTYNVRNEVEGSHCATALRWHYGETAALVTSIGPGALHALAGSLAAASNGIGVYYIFGDETTHEEGPNMQQVPKPEQHSFLDLVKTMGQGITLHTPEVIFTALRRGAATVFNPGFAGPYYFLAPMNTQPEVISECNLLELPDKPYFPSVACHDDAVFDRATQLVKEAQRITIKYGGGAVGCGAEIVELARLIDAVIISGAKTVGVVPYSEQRYMSVGGSKGSLCGNFAMNEADLIIVIGARGVCQWDCSGTAWKHAEGIINFNIDPYYVSQYNRSVYVLGDAKTNLRTWISRLKNEGFKSTDSPSPWLAENSKNKEQWEMFKSKRYNNPLLYDKNWKQEVLTQPAAIKIAYEFARKQKAARYFDAGDVQANGFQIVEDEEFGLTYNETGASYMGFAASGLLAAGLAEHPTYTFACSGDGSFTMNPQVLFDGVQHGVQGCILLFDNRSMGAIRGLQMAQYGQEYKTADQVQTDYVAMAQSVQGVKGLFAGFKPETFKEALQEAYEYQGLSLIHVPVYSGDHELGGLGAFGDWNVGNWCERVQAEHHRIGL
jgi:3D-(3,5/4)-trihydroxycyclohexane-1,2-dione acylhydrolase (decyclizing)